MNSHVEGVGGKRHSCYIPFSPFADFLLIQGNDISRRTIVTTFEYSWAMRLLLQNAF